VAGKRPKLVISSPPQHGKSLAVTDFMAWAMGLNPDLKVIFASYSDALGERASIDLSTDSQQRDLHQGLWSHAHWAAQVEADQQFF
jgi:hypothetical protein